ncbi:DUF3626 domain-containing protein [Allokutzneria albata]|uniref:DUF3626 domain-containing protein n=1 Tax=Allokutzneria albata TaxID=211114 RepID=A0A1H0DRN8_ALLAB|nr:DUF3626 domain-containing protein [Allokutzneria albata]SDN72719.1 Protein of unknown function [Allokutzneria albata]
MRSPQERAIAFVAERSVGTPIAADLRVNLHLHPERALESIVRDGTYRSQFETGTSNGGLTAHPGGDRWRWESRIFGAAYDDAPPAERPKYGALNFRRRAAGAAVRFGSAHFRLSWETMRRTTFCYPDSVFEPVDFGVAERMSLVEKANADSQDLLDDYVEAHVHGAVTVGTDVEALVLDPCFRGTEVERLAAELPCPVEWHHGFRLGVDVLRAHADYRGPDVVELGESLARNGYIDARVIGEAARTGQYDPQRLKRLWHCTARFGYSWFSA